MKTVFPPPAAPLIPIVGRALFFPVRRVYCVGRNYSDHMREMGLTGRELPVFFSKPADAIVPMGGDLPYPSQTENLHYEAEFVIAIGTGGANITVNDALSHVFGYAVGLDMTRRDLQAVAKEKNQPWEMSKAFDHSAPISAIMPVDPNGAHPTAGRLWLTVNGEMKQDADIADMNWKAAEIIANLSQFITLASGDLIFTGTPSGVSAVVRGDRIETGIDKIGTLSVRIV